MLHLEKGILVGSARRWRSGMKFFHLVLANLGRHKRRTFLTIASVALALFLFASLRTVVTTLGAAAAVRKRAPAGDRPTRAASSSRSRSSYANRLSAVHGVDQRDLGQLVRRQVRRRQALLRPVRGRRQVLPRDVPRDVGPRRTRSEAFLQDRSGALIGVRLLDMFGWKVGQNVTLQGTIFPGRLDLHHPRRLHADGSR